MSARGPADTPPPRDGQMPEGAPAADPTTPESPVLSLEDRKAERRRLREAEDAGLDGDRRQAKLLRMENRRNNAPRPNKVRAPDPLGQGDAPQASAAPARRELDDNDGFERQTPRQPRPPVTPSLQPAGPARVRARHWGVVISFLALVVLPTAIAAWYLWDRASPRYASTVGFSIRTEQAPTAMDMLGGIVAMGGGGSSSSDTDILYRYIQSQEIVRTIDARLDLRALWTKGDPDRDPVFVYHPPGTIEDLTDYWQRMVTVYNDSGTGLLDIEVQAFTAEDAQRISQAIYEESQRLINQLSDIAQADKTRLAREELDESLNRLKDARAALTQFRNLHQIVDPQATLQTQMGLLGKLQEQLAQTLIELDTLRETASDDDPRVQQALDRVNVIQARIADERANLGMGSGSGRAADGAAPDDGAADPSGEAFADVVGDYERLQVDQEFAQQTYIAARAAYDQALAESRQQSRYLAAHIEPTLAERAEYPQRWELTLLTLLFATLAWMMLTLGAYALRDRR